MKHPITTPCLIVFAALCSFLQTGSAVDFSEGEVLVLPVSENGPPAIDGDGSDWNLNAQEPAFIDAGTAATMNTQWAFMADDDALYVLVETSLPGRPYHNPNDPHERFWLGDLLQLRITSDPALDFPLSRDRDHESNRVIHISMWKNSDTKEEFIHLAFGTKFDLGTEVNPPGSAIRVVEHEDRYLLEARIPWAALNVPDGKKPFGEDRPGIGVAEVIWSPAADASRTKLGYTTDGGVFSFSRPHTWGRMNYVARAPESRLRPKMADLLAQMAGSKVAADSETEIGVPVVINIPEDGLSASVNIFGAKGEVIRELFVGHNLPQGPLTVRWDGFDAFGKPVELGTYRWGAYLHRGLEVEFMGSVGISGKPPFPTANGLGMWGGDHSNPIDVAADETGRYFLWPVAEAGRALVKTDYQGNTLYRVTPFTGGGFGPFFAITQDGEHLYVVRGREEIFLNRLDRDRGRVQPWEALGVNEVPLFKSTLRAVPLHATPVGIKPTNSGKNPNMLPPVDEGWTYSPDCLGIAVIGDRIFASSFSGDAIRIFNKLTGAPEGELKCIGPRGLVVRDGDLFAASYEPGKPGRILQFVGGKGEGRVIVSEGLDAPFDLAFDEKGHLYVSDMGESQQVKVFSSNGSLLRSLGSKGGRPWQGAYEADATNFLMPSGLAVDQTNKLIVAESSPPKVFSSFSLPDLALVDRWYGAPTYWTSTFPMPDNPRNIFYMLSYALGRADLGGPDKVGVPNAYWQPDRAGFPDIDNIESIIPFPRVLRADNGRLYFAKDSAMREIYVFEEDQTMRPIAQFRFLRKQDDGNELGKDHLRIWVDANADGLQQEDEVTVLEKFANGEPVTGISNSGKSMAFFPNGEVFLQTSLNAILRVPVKEFGKDGQIVWDLAGIAPIISEVYPGLDRHAHHHRAGALGIARNSRGEFYVPFNARLRGGSGVYDFPDEQSANAALGGMGHTSSSNAVKFIKFDPAGNFLWMAGRKAQSGARPGEIYHFWNLAGMVGDNYVAGGSEWGTVAFYTDDGFYVDTIFNNPASAPPAGPMTFGGETSGANVTYFPDLDEVWAYNTSRAFRVKGFKNGRVIGEQRLGGDVVLDQIYRAEKVATALDPIVIQKTNKDLFAESADWSAVPASLLLREGQQLAEARFGLDDEWLYGRIEVRDPSPMENEADQVELAFKWGDSVAVVLGPAGEREEAAPGDLRILAAEVGGEPKLIGMKPMSKLERKPFEYTTPASGTVAFDFVGEIPDGKIRLDRSADGYVATFAVPRKFIETELADTTKLRGDVELRLSGQGQRGLQATSRNYLFTPATAATTMVDDIPVEAKLYPGFWGPLEVRPQK